MNETIFFRLLAAPIDEKADNLSANVALLRAGEIVPITYTISAVDFKRLPGTPYAYWVERKILDTFATFPPLEKLGRTAKRGPSSGDDFRRIRAWWEIPTEMHGRKIRWVPFSKGGGFSPFYYDVHLVIDWDDERNTFNSFLGRPGREIPQLEASSYFFLPGITWPRRPHRQVSFRELPAECIFAENGPTIFCSQKEALPLLALLNSSIFSLLGSLFMGRGSENGGQTLTYEVGIVQALPVPDMTDGSVKAKLSELTLIGYETQRQTATTDEVTHAFSVPNL